MHDISGIIVTGECKDIIRRDGKIIDVIKSHNIVVNSSLNLIAGVVGNQISNELYWAVGSGSKDWDDTPIDPVATETKLTSEIGRKLINPTTNIEFYDNVNKSTTTPTNRLHFSILFEEDECNGVWREFGIFGGDASVAIDSGIMIDKKHHGVVTKDTNTTIERHLIITFKYSTSVNS